MILRTARNFAFPAPRRVYAVLLAVFVNLALLPCATALEVVEEVHDCCPPELNLESSECCEVDDATVDKRKGMLKPWDSPDSDDLATDALGMLVAPAPARRLSAADPPDPPPNAQPLHKLFCIYLI